MQTCPYRILIPGILLLMALPAQAQFFGLQMAESAVSKPVDSWESTVGLQLSDFGEYFGGRINYGYSDSLSVFGEVGLADPDVTDGGLSTGLGAVYAFMNRLPFDNGIFASAHLPFIEDVDAFSVRALGIGSGRLASLETVTWYGGLGGSYVSIEDSRGLGSEKEDRFELNVSGGAMHQWSESVSMYAEIDFADDVFFGCGIRWAFQ